MRKRALLGAWVAVWFAMTVRAAGVDFSGNWLLIERIPSVGAKLPDVLLVIRQAGNDLEVTTSMVGQERTLEEHYTLDGAENINREQNGTGSATIRSTSQWEGDALVLAGSRAFAGPSGEVTYRWKTEYQLSPDGAVLTVTRTIRTPFGDIPISEVFRRK